MLASWDTTCAGGSAVLYKVRRKLLSQNFLYSRTLVNSLVRNSSIGPNDIVLEIGPGKGFITSELLQVAKEVIAVEVDPKLVLHLQQFFRNNPNLNLFLANFLDFRLPWVPYKVFANIPFSIEGQIVRKLLDTKNPPDDTYLVVRKDLAQRLSGKFGNNLFYISHAPWFEFNIYHYFNRNDFTPSASMDCVMWRITKRHQPLIPSEEMKNFKKFIELAFGNGANVDLNLKQLLSREQLKSLSNKLSFNFKRKPSYLSQEQWVQLYKLATNRVIL